MTSETSATAASPPVPRPRTLLFLPGDVMPGAITSSSGSSSPEVFFDATDGLSLPPPADTPDTDIREDIEDHHESFRATQQGGEVCEGFHMTHEHSDVYGLNENRSQSNQVAMNAETKVYCHDSLQGWRHPGNILMVRQTTVRQQDYENTFTSPVYGTSTDPRHGDGNITEVDRDHDKHSSNVVSDRKHRKHGQNNASGNRCMCYERETEQRQKSRDVISKPGCSSQESDFLDIKVNSDHCEVSESLDVKTNSEQWEGGESSAGGRLASSQQRVSASHSLIRCLHDSHDGHLSHEPGGSEIHPLPLSTPSATVMPSRWAIVEQLQNSTSVSNLTSFQTRGVLDMEGRASQVSKHEVAPANDYKQSPHSSLKPRTECQRKAGKSKPNTCGHRQLGEVFPVEKPWGSSLREETRKIVMMLSNDRACKVPRPSLGLQDRLQTLWQRSAGRRTTCLKGPSFCSTLVKSIVTNTHHRLQARRDSFQEFIKGRKEQFGQRVFANPVPCYGSTGATVSRIPSITKVVVGENRSVEDGGGVGRDGAAGSSSSSSSITASGSSRRTRVGPAPAALSATVQGTPPPACHTQEDMNDYLIHGNQLNSTNENGGTRIVNANTTTLGENIANSHETDTNEVLLGAKILINNTSGTDASNSTEGVQMESETPGGSASRVLQDNSEDARQTVMLLRQSKTECSTRQHPASFCPATQAVTAEDTKLPASVEVSSVLDGPDDVVEQVNRKNNVAEMLAEVPGKPVPSDRHENTDIASSTSRSSVGGTVDKLGATTSFPTSAKTIETFTSSKTKRHFPRRPTDDSSNAIDLQEHIASLDKVSADRLAEARGVDEGAREAGDSPAGGGQEPHLSSTNHQDSQQVVSPAHIGPGLTGGSQNSSEASHNSYMTTDRLHYDSIDKVRETVSLSDDTYLASGGDQPHPEDGAGNIVIQENVQRAGDARASSVEAATVRQPGASLHGEAEATQAEPHHLWSCLQDITKLKTDNLVARFRGTRPVHAVLWSQYPRPQPTPASAPPQLSKESIPIPPHPQPSPGSRTMTTTRENEGQTPVDGLNTYNTDGRPLPPDTQQESVDECYFLPDSRQGSIDRRSHPNSRELSVDECPNIIQGSSEGRPSPVPNSRQGSVVDSRCAGQRRHPPGRLDARSDSSGGRLSFSADRKRKRANSYHPRSRQCSVDYVCPSSRRDSRNIHHSCYPDDKRDSNNVCLYPCSRRGRGGSFGPDLLRKCLEAAVDTCDVMEWEETMEEQEAAAMTLSQEDLNTCLRKAVCSLDAEKAKMLLQLGADPNVRCGPSPALLRAVQHGALHVVQALLAAGADVDVRTDTGNSSLHVAARGGHGHVAVQLVDSGAHVDAINRSGVTPLQVALACGHPEVAGTLLRLQADMFLPNKVGETAYEIANHLGYVGLCGSGWEGGRDSASGPWEEEAAPSEVPAAVRMIQGIEAGCPATVEGCLAEGASPDTVVPLALHWPAGATVLHRAAHHGHALIARLLLAAGAHVNRQDVVGNMPVHAAAQAGHNRVVKLLLREGALLEARSQSGMTPLHRAASKGKEFTCNLLLRRGCDPQAQDDAGLTPADWARRRGFKALAKKLVYRRKSSASLLADTHRKHYLHHLSQLHEAALKAAQQEVEAMDCPE